MADDSFEPVKEPKVLLNHKDNGTVEGLIPAPEPDPSLPSTEPSLPSTPAMQRFTAGEAPELDIPVVFSAREVPDTLPYSKYRENDTELLRPRDAVPVSSADLGDDIEEAPRAMRSNELGRGAEEGVRARRDVVFLNEGNAPEAESDRPRRHVMFTSTEEIAAMLEAAHGLAGAEVKTDEGVAAPLPTRAEKGPKQDSPSL